MSILNAARPTSKSSAARRPRAAAPTLTLTIDGVPFAVRLNVEADEQWGVAAALCGPDGRWFVVSNELAGEGAGLTSGHCSRCEARGEDGCEHLRAAMAVGMF